MPKRGERTVRLCGVQSIEISKEQIHRFKTSGRMRGKYMVAHFMGYAFSCANDREKHLPRFRACVRVALPLRAEYRTFYYCCCGFVMVSDGFRWVQNLSQYIFYGRAPTSFRQVSARQMLIMLVNLK